MPITTLSSTHIISTPASNHEDNEEYKEQSPRFSLTIHIPLESELIINYIENKKSPSLGVKSAIVLLSNKYA